MSVSKVLKLFFPIALFAFTVSCSDNDFKSAKPNQGKYHDLNPASDKCIGEHEILGSAGFIVNDATSVELFWNYFKAQGPLHVAYYKVVVMEESMNPNLTFHSPPIYGTSYTVKPGIPDQYGNTIRINLTKDTWFWYDIFAYDSNGQLIPNYQNPGKPFYKRFDIQQSNYHSPTVITGYCSFKFY